MKILDWINIKVLLWFWGTMTLVWSILLVPSVLWWKESILWVIIMSWWANVASSAAAFVAAHNEMKQDRREGGESNGA